MNIIVNEYYQKIFNITQKIPRQLRIPFFYDEPKIAFPAFVRKPESGLWIYYETHHAQVC